MSYDGQRYLVLDFVLMLIPSANSERFIKNVSQCECRWLGFFGMWE